MDPDQRIFTIEKTEASHGHVCDGLNCRREADFRMTYAIGELRLRTWLCVQHINEVIGR